MALNFRDGVSLVRLGSSVVGAPFRNFGKFVYPSLPTGVFQMRQYKPLIPSIWCLCNTGGKCVTCRGLHILA